MSDQPVTLYISRRIKPGNESQIDAWQKRIHDACSQFNGFVGSKVLERHDGEPNTYDVIVRFDSFQNLRKWEESDERQTLYRELEPMIESQSMSRLRGYAPWFPSPDDIRPPAWKMCIMAFIAVYPIILISRVTLGPMVSDMPLPLNVLILCLPVSFLMSFFAMPWLSKLFHKWLYPNG